MSRRSIITATIAAAAGFVLGALLTHRKTPDGSSDDENNGLQYGAQTITIDNVEHKLPVYVTAENVRPGDLVQELVSGKYCVVTYRASDEYRYADISVLKKDGTPIMTFGRKGDIWGIWRATTGEAIIEYRTATDDELDFNSIHRKVGIKTTYNELKNKYSHIKLISYNTPRSPAEPDYVDPATLTTLHAADGDDDNNDPWLDEQWVSNAGLPVATIDGKKETLPQKVEASKLLPGDLVQNRASGRRYGVVVWVSDSKYKTPLGSIHDSGDIWAIWRETQEEALEEYWAATDAQLEMHGPESKLSRAGTYGIRSGLYYEVWLLRRGVTRQARPDYVDPATLTTLHAAAHNVTDRDKFYAKRLWDNKKDMVIRLTGIKEFDPDDDDQVRQLSNIYTTSEPFIEKYKDKVDWDEISYNQQLSEPFIEKYKDKVNWDEISSWQQLSESFIEKYKDKVNWYRISSRQQLSESFIEKYKDKVDWINISYKQQLSESFIEKYKGKVNWNGISYGQQLSEPFIEKYKDKVDWINISSRQQLSEPFIEKHKDRVSWDDISFDQQLSEPFIEKYKNKVDWDRISSEQKLSESFIEKYKDKVDWYMISSYQQLSEPFIEKHKDRVSWDGISYNQQLSEPFIEKYKDKVDWDYISYNQQLSDPFIEKYKDKVDWHRISSGQKLSEPFIEKYKDKVDWNWISSRQQLSESFIEKYKDKVDWYRISSDQQLSEPFIEKYKDRVNWNKISQNIRVVRDTIYDYVDPATLTTLHAAPATMTEDDYKKAILDMVKELQYRYMKQSDVYIDFWNNEWKIDRVKSDKYAIAQSGGISNKYPTLFMRHLETLAFSDYRKKYPAKPNASQYSKRTWKDSKGIKRTSGYEVPIDLRNENYIKTAFPDVIQGTLPALYDYLAELVDAGEPGVDTDYVDPATLTTLHAAPTGTVTLSNEIILLMDEMQKLYDDNVLFADYRKEPFKLKYINHRTDISEDIYRLDQSIGNQYIKYLESQATQRIHNRLANNDPNLYHNYELNFELPGGMRYLIHIIYSPTLRSGFGVDTDKLNIMGPLSSIRDYIVFLVKEGKRPGSNNINDYVDPATLTTLHAAPGPDQQAIQKIVRVMDRIDSYYRSLLPQFRAWHGRPFVVMKFDYRDSEEANYVLVQDPDLKDVKNDCVQNHPMYYVAALETELTREYQKQNEYGTTQIMERRGSCNNEDFNFSFTYSIDLRKKYNISHRAGALTIEGTADDILGYISELVRYLPGYIDYVDPASLTTLHAAPGGSITESDNNKLAREEIVELMDRISQYYKNLLSQFKPWHDLPFNVMKFDIDKTRPYNSVLVQDTADNNDPCTALFTMFYVAALETEMTSLYIDAHPNDEYVYHNRTWVCDDGFQHTYHFMFNRTLRDKYHLSNAESLTLEGDPVNIRDYLSVLAQYIPEDATTGYVDPATLTTLHADRYEEGLTYRDLRPGDIVGTDMDNDLPYYGVVTSAMDRPYNFKTSTGELMVGTQGDVWGIWSGLGRAAAINYYTRARLEDIDKMNPDRQTSFFGDKTRKYTRFEHIDDTEIDNLGYVDPATLTTLHAEDDDEDTDPEPIMAGVSPTALRPGDLVGTYVDYGIDIGDGDYFYGVVVHVFNDDYNYVDANDNILPGTPGDVWAMWTLMEPGPAVSAYTNLTESGKDITNPSKIISYINNEKFNVYSRNVGQIPEYVDPATVKTLHAEDVKTYKQRYRQARTKADLEPNKPMRSWLPDKKMVVLAKKGRKTKLIHFGNPAYEDYTQHRDPVRRRNYLKRSAGIRDGKGRLTKDNKFSANYWARKVLW